MSVFAQSRTNLVSISRSSMLLVKKLKNKLLNILNLIFFYFNEDSYDTFKKKSMTEDTKLMVFQEEVLLGYYTWWIPGKNHQIMT